MSREVKPGKALKDQEMEALRQENAALAAQLTDTQLALCDVYELLMPPATGGEVNG